MSTDEKLDAIIAKLERLERIVPLVEEFLIKRPTVAEQAKNADVHPSTIWRRRKREELRRLLGLL